MARITRYTPARLSPLGGRYDPGYEILWPVTRLHQEMNRLFSDAFRGFEEGGDESREGWTFNPVVDVDEQDEQYEISIELPGVMGEDVNVEVSDDMLMVSGTKERKRTRGEGENRQSERVYGSFQRAFRLPEDSVRENVAAHFNDGVLTINVPRDESRRQPASRRIEIQRGAPEGKRQQAVTQGEQQEPAQGAAKDEQKDRPQATH